MVGVIVADHDVINLLQTGLLRCRINPFGVAAIDFEAGVDQHRLARRRQNQCGRTTFHVNPVNLQIARLGPEHRGGNQQQCQKYESQHDGIFARRDCFGKVKSANVAAAKGET